ncbi:hypothetical protein TNCV_1217821 [Trichonephila clavipes]|nr:hypothetical protein TNCV_1217821 [Trichonephila clavipes]
MTLGTTHLKVQSISPSFSAWRSGAGTTPPASRRILLVGGKKGPSSKTRASDEEPRNFELRSSAVVKQKRLDEYRTENGSGEFGKMHLTTLKTELEFIVMNLILLSETYPKNHDKSGTMDSLWVSKRCLEAILNSLVKYVSDRLLGALEKRK